MARDENDPLNKRLSAAIERPKRPATQDEVDMITRFWSAAWVGSALRGLFTWKPNTGDVHVLHPDERDAVTKQMNLALDRIESRQRKNAQRRLNRTINSFARQSEADRKRRSGQ